MCSGNLSPKWSVSIDGLSGDESSDSIRSVADKRYDIALDGRIYNYKELAAKHGIAANSEQELLGALYATTGTALFGMLQGMFAIAIYDRELNEVVCARDRFGIKTLYYCRMDNGIILSNKLTGFSPVQADINRKRQKILLPEWYTKAMPEEITAQYLDHWIMTRLQKMQCCDCNLWLPCDILYQANRVTAANGVEVRTPFLDNRVYDVARILADSDKVGNGEGKVLLREALSDLLPYETIHRPKKGFPIPVLAWLQNELYDWAAEILGSPAAAELIHTTYALSLLELHRKSGGADPHLFRQLWLLLSLIKWFSQIGER